MSCFSHRAEVLYSNRAKVLGLFADILDYPAPRDWRIKRPNAGLCSAACSRRRPLCWRLSLVLPRRHPVGKLQEVYSGFFDLNSICHPYVGYQLFGENYKRSIFLVELKKAYRAEGFEADASEIPDRLSIVLRFAAQSEGEDVDALLNKGLLPALERMTTKPETEGHSAWTMLILMATPE